MMSRTKPPYARPGLLGRLPGALRRRWRYLRERLSGRGPHTAIEAALDALLQSESNGGLRATRADVAPNAALTGASVETALAYGCREEARRWAQWLISMQQPEGSIRAGESSTATSSCGGMMRPASVRFPSRMALGDPVSAFDHTARAIQGWLAILEPMPNVPGVEEALHKACEYLCSQIAHANWERPPDSPNPTGLDGTAAPNGLPCLGSLLRAAKRFGRTDWEAAVDWAARRSRQQVDASCPFRSVRDLVTHAEHCLEWLDSANEARRLLDQLIRSQRPNGSLPERFRGGPFLSDSQALAALLWYRVGHGQPADRALQSLETKCGRGGTLPGGWGPFATASLRRGHSWATKHYLDAALERVRSTFDDTWRRFPEKIDPHDGRMQAVRQWFERLGPNARVADLGCGRGRFLRHLAEWFPRAQLTGIDICPAALGSLPLNTARRIGSLLCIPAADGAFDGAFAVESLEHALVPRRAIGEICRVVRPGGRLLLIDKHRAKQALSRHDRWERWFLPSELTQWLAPYCDEVTVTPVSHNEGQAGDSLFLAASGTRRRTSE